MRARLILSILPVVLPATQAFAQGGDESRFGTGCPSGRIEANGWAPHPGLGQLSFWAWNRLPGQPVLAVLGSSNRRWGPLRLPLDLGVLGLPTCQLYTDISVTVGGRANGIGAVEFRWPVPADPALAGGELFAQLIGANDARVNPAVPLTTSSAVAYRIGGMPQLDGFQLRGDPAVVDGAPWTYRGIHGGVSFDLLGRLFVPAGSPPAGGFPAILVSHGGGGSANGYSRGIANQMVPWGVVCIAVNYTHTDTFRYGLGSPGGFLEKGGYSANVLRALRCVEILRSLGYVNMNRIGAHGNSNGALLTTALAAAAPGLIRAASHTAGGIDDTRAPQYPSAATAGLIRTPYLIQHGDLDTLVPIQLDQDLVDVLAYNNVPHEFVIWTGYGHELGGPNSPAIGSVLARVRQFFRLHGVL